MPSFSIDINKTNGNLRIIVPVLIGDASEVPASSQKEQPQRINISGEIVSGLVDTGATMTCVTADFAKRLKLTPCGTREMMTASHRNIKTNSYRISVVIVIHGQVTPVIKSDIKPNVVLPMSAPAIIEAGEFVNAGKGDVEVLIGMDIIRMSVMTITGHDNRLTMSF